MKAAVISALDVGDICMYDNSPVREGKYAVESIYDHGSDPNQRIVIAKQLFGKPNPKKRFIFDVKVVSGKIELYHPFEFLIRNLEEVVETRQERNKRRGVV